MEKRFHLFVRRVAGIGYSVEVLTHPHITAFAADVDTARTDVAKVLSRLLARDPQLQAATTYYADARLRRVELTLRALQHDRLLPVPMRFTAVTHGHPLHAHADARVVRIPRLEATRIVRGEENVEAVVEEVVRFELYMAPLERLLELAYSGDETLESLSVSYKARAAASSAATATAAAPIEACRDLCEEARAGRIERAFMRDALLTRVIDALDAKRRASVLLIGANGVGKSAIVHEIAHRAVEAEEGTRLHGLALWATAGSRIVAGMHYMGEWQARVQRIIDALRGRRAVLHLEGLSDLVSGDRSEGGLDIARYLTAAIEAGDLSVICEATAEEVARVERSHPTFLRAMRPVHVEALRDAEGMRALESVAARIARGNKVRFSPESIARAAELTERFGSQEALPGAAVPLLRAAAQRDESKEGTSTTVLTPDDVLRSFCARTGYPKALVDASVKLDPDEVLRELESRVFGQPEAMALLRDLVVTLKVGLSDPSRPLGSFLFLGPTGVGKTESAASLATYLFGDASRMVRFDMSEYAAPGSAIRLVSNAAGASLTRRVRERPFGLVLLDEIEKADSGVHDLLLQILGEARLTDAAGRTVSFRNTVVVLTSNLGADTASRTVGFDAHGPQRDVGAHYLSAAATFFRPELLNRIDHVVPFHPLSEVTVRAIARRAVDAALLREGLVRRGVRVRYDDAVLSRVIELGYDARYGARPLKRAVEKHVVGPLSRLLSARGAAVPREVELVARAGGIAVAPTSTPEVLAMEPAAVKAELARRAERRNLSETTIALNYADAPSRARALWLAERYARFVESHGGTAHIEATAEQPVLLRARGAASGLLTYERGLHEFSRGTLVTRVQVRDPSAVVSDDEVLARLYTDDPAPSVFDVSTEVEHVGSWDEATDGTPLDRFVLARVATG